jgi:hypothetical protein
MLRRAQRIAFARVLGGGGGRNWLVVAASIWLLRKANEIRRPQPELVYRRVLAPGQTLLVDHTLTDRRGKPVPRRRRR